MPTAAQVLKTAASQIGTVESPAGSNRQKYGVAMGLNGEPWCAIFQWWCFEQNGVDLRTVFGQPSWAVSYCPDLLTSFRGKGWAHTWPDVKPGDLVFYAWDGGSTAEHVGIVESVQAAAGTVTTIEGNTAVGNESNGGEVMRRVRDHSFILGLGRYPFSVSTPQELNVPYVAQNSTGPDQWLVDSGVRSHIVDGPSSTAYQKAFGPAIPVTAAQLATIKIAPTP